MEIGHTSEAQRKSLNMHQFCAAVLFVLKLLCFNKNVGCVWGYEGRLKNQKSPIR